MDRHSTPQQLQRLRELAQELGATSQDELITLSPPRQRPTFRDPDDERKAEAVLGQLKIEASQNGTRPKGLRRAFSTIGSGKNTPNYTYEGVNAALTRVVEENGLAGVAEVLLAGFKQLGGDINIARRASNGLIKKIRNTDSPEERGHLLETATENSRLDFVQLLAPDADQPSLNESLNIALQNKNPAIIQTLLQYGANSTVQQQAFETAARNGNVQIVNIMLRAPRRVPEHCVTRSLLPAVMSGSLPVVLQLLQAGANGNYDGASALMFAVEASRLDLVAAILTSHNPPSPPMVNDALNSALSVPSSILVERYTLAELLLCSGPHGDASNEGLVKATVLSNVKMMQLFLNHRSDINHNNGCAIANAMQRNRADLVGILLQDQDLRPDVASELVGRIARTAPPEDRIALLSKLLINGASGVHCNELLIMAASQNDIETARILVMHGKEEHTPVVSVDYNAAKALEIAVSQNNLSLVKILALEGSPSEFSLSKAFASMPKLTGDHRYLMVQTLLRAGARGAEVDSFLRASIASQENSKRLIDLLVQFGAEVDDQTLLATVSQGNVDILQILLSKNGSVAACSAAVPVAMKLPIGQARYRIVKLLVVNITAAGADNAQIGQAVVDLIRNCPHDLKLLRLLCQEGKANINFEGGLSILLATRHDNPAVLDIILQSEGGPPALDTIGNALRCIIELPISDAKRSYKAQAILRGTKPQQVMNEALVQEIQAALIDKRDKSMIETLLVAGADVNALDAASICHAVRDQEIMDLILSKRPKPESLALALPLAMAMGDPERTLLCEKLMRAGAVGEQINKALCTAVDEGEMGLPMMQILLPQADVNYKNGRVLCLAVKQVFQEAIDLLLAPRPVVASSSTKAVAFQEAMKLEVREERHAVIKKLLGAKIPKQVLSEALVPAVNCADYELVESLLQSGAYIDHTNGKAVQSAASSGYRDILKMLVDGKLTSKPSLSIMTSAFGGALALKEKDADSYYQTIEILLATGLKGEVVDSALYDAVKEGDSSLQSSRLLYSYGASVEWNHGVIVDLAAKSASIETLRLLFSKPVSPTTLRRAYRSSLALPTDQRLEVVSLILDAGMAIDKHVTGTLFRAAQENPADHQLIKLLLSHHVFDEGESMAYVVEHLDLDTLALLVESPQASLYTDSAFRTAMDTESIWESNLGLSIMETMLEKGAAGPAVSEALLKAIENYKSGPDDRLDLLLRFGADVNHQRGLALQIAAQQVNLDLILKLLPSSSSDSKAMAIPYLFKATSDKATILKILQAFIDSIEDDEQTLDIGFRHPDLELEPVLFMALNSFPRRTQILRALLDMGYSANQWGLYEVDPEVGQEPWPVLCWALSQPEKKISSANIELLIDEGANVTFTSKSGITPVTLSIIHQRPDILSKLISAGAKVTASDPSGITPLALASQSGNTKLMEHLLVAGAEIDDGSLHDAARDLRCDAMRVLVKYGHDPDYPSERHDGRSALAELCLNAVETNPTRLQLEEGVQFLIASSSDFRLRSKPSEHSSGKTIFHHALDSSDPMTIMQILLKLPLWKVINEDDFLFSDSTHTYSLTKYVTKGLSLGPKSQNEALVHLLQTKRCIPKFYAHAPNVPQPDDIINAPPHIVAEITRQRAREKRVQEQKEEALALLDIKRTAAEEEGKILQLRTTHDIRREMELSRAELHLLEQKSQTEIQLLESRSQSEQRLQSERQRLEQEHVRSLGQIQVQNQRAIRHAEIEEDATRELMQLEYLEKKQQREHDGMRQRFAIEGAERQEREKMDKRMHEREAARMKMQRSILDRQQGLAGSIMAGQGQFRNGGDRRQIGYVVGEV